MSLTFLVTGGSGFVGANIALHLRMRFGDSRVFALDSLLRRGSELNLRRLKESGVEFVHGDVRQPEDLELGVPIDVVVDCAAEPSVLAGYQSSPLRVIQINLLGTVNCLELARQHKAKFIFLSTSRVYPISRIESLAFCETDTRYELADVQDTPGVSARGIAEDFPLTGTRSLYGASKLASELLLLEYLEMFGLDGVVNRCGTIAGPWQMGKVDQGVVTLWVARHMWGDFVEYMGYGGTGKQVRDILHVDDLCDLVVLEVENIGVVRGQILNIGGGMANSLSLVELTALCEKITRRKVALRRRMTTSPVDVRLYVSDTSRAQEMLGWRPQRDVSRTLLDIATWLESNRDSLFTLFVDEGR